ncbi:hypothetical protein FGO68_gene5999 [Halteria grandinella]|uniref:Uncharacterized protein n=1 Tax=Halteria grandinella TaxID=5974 RepID=A0A8J8NJ21_HALGN|nr:hypothetical protein FGO68_gene5999 [Halteria grandinella]
MMGANRMACFKINKQSSPSDKFSAYLGFIECLQKSMHLKVILDSHLFTQLSRSKLAEVSLGVNVLRVYSPL